MTSKMIYCTGPSTSPEERRQLHHLEAGLRSAGMRTYLPHRDGLEALYPALLAGDDEMLPKWTRLIFAFNTGRLIRSCDALVFSMNGRVPDEGGLVAAALAAMSGIPVILYKQDHRSVFYGYDNAMAIGLSRAFATVESTDAMVKAVRREIEQTDPNLTNHQLPPAMAAAVELGRELAEILAGELPLTAGDDLKADTKQKILTLYDDSDWAGFQAGAPGPASGTGRNPVTESESGRPVRRIYCSGPLFCPGEIKDMKNIAEALETTGWRTYLPHRDGVESFVMKNTNRFLANLLRPLVRYCHRLTFAVDLYFILKCDCIVFNLNGRVPDEGGVAEVGLAFAAGKPVIFYWETVEIGASESPALRPDIHFNPMILGLGSLTTPSATIDRIPGQVAQIDMIRYRPQDLTHEGDTLSSHMRGMIRLGQRASQIMNRISFLKPRTLF